MGDTPTIYYTLTDEAPALATCSLLPIVRVFTEAAGIAVKVTDVSLAGRILSAFTDKLNEDQRVADGLAFLGELTQQAKQNLQAPWLAFTAFATFSIMLSLLVFISEGVRDAFDPRTAKK